MDQYDEYDDPDQLKDIFSSSEQEWDSEYEDALTDRMHRQAEQEARINANNPHYIPPTPIPSMLDQYKEGDLILSDFNQERLEMKKIKQSKEFNAKLISIIKNSIFNFIYIFIGVLFQSNLCDLGRRLFHMQVVIQQFRQLTGEYQYLIQMVSESIFDAFLVTLHLQFWYYFIFVIQQNQFHHLCYCIIRLLLRKMSSWLSRIKIKER